MTMKHSEVRKVTYFFVAFITYSIFQGENFLTIWITWVGNINFPQNPLNDTLAIRNWNIAQIIVVGGWSHVVVDELVLGRDPGNFKAIIAVSKDSNPVAKQFKYHMTRVQITSQGEFITPNAQQQFQTYNYYQL